MTIHLFRDAGYPPSPRYTFLPYIDPASLQDTFLPHIEDGTIILLGATTENPSFELNGALLSRCQVIVLKKLEVHSLEDVVRRALPLIGAMEEDTWLPSMGDQT